MRSIVSCGRRKENRMDRIEALLEYSKCYQTDYNDYLYYGLIVFMWHFNIWYWWEVLLGLYVLAFLYASHSLSTIYKEIEEELGLA